MNKQNQAVGIFHAMLVSALLLLLVPGAASAQALSDDSELIRPGITPASPFYFLDKAFDNLGLAFTFTAERKAEKAVGISNERLAEVKAMLEANKFEDASAAQEEHSKAIGKVRNFAAQIKADDPLQRLEKEISLERELELHGIALEETKLELKIKSAVKNGPLQFTEQARVEMLFSSMEDPVEGVKSAIGTEKEKARLEFKATGRTDAQAEAEIQRLEDAHNLLELKRQKAEDRIKDSSEKIEDARSGLDELGSSGADSLSDQLDIAEQIHEQALEAFRNGKFGEAFGQSTASFKLAQNVLRGVDNEGSQPVQERTEIRADVMAQNGTEVRVELRFASGQVQKDAIAQEIKNKLMLSTESISSMLRIRNETQQLQDRMEARAKPKDGMSEVRFELRFPLGITNPNDRAGIVAGISQKLASVTAAQISAALEMDNGGRGRNGENETEIEIEVEDGIAKVKVEVNDDKLRFRMPFTTQDAVFAEIASRTGIAVDTIRSLARVESEDFENEIENELQDRRSRGRGRDDELRGREFEAGEDVRGNADENEIRGNADENELRGRDNEPGEDIRGNADENEVRGREAEGEAPRGADSPSDFDSTPNSRGGSGSSN